MRRLGLVTIGVVLGGCAGLAADEEPAIWPERMDSGPSVLPTIPSALPPAHVEPEVDQSADQPVLERLGQRDEAVPRICGNDCGKDRVFDSEAQRCVSAACDRDADCPSDYICDADLEMCVTCCLPADLGSDSPSAR